MGRANSQNRVRKIYEWEKGLIGNIGVVTPHPYDILFNHIREKNVIDIIQQFFNKEITQIDLLDQCVLEQFWWTEQTIKRARYSKIEHPEHYSGEYVFDKSNGERTIIEIRQPDIDGKHWCADHIHIKRGNIDSESLVKIVRPSFNEHVELTSTVIDGVYIMRMPQELNGIS